MHRVQQIVNAAAGLIAANASLRATVEVNRVRSLADEQPDSPCVTVNYGGDVPDEAQDQRDIASAVEILLTAYAFGDSETDVLQSLLDMRTQTHVALMADMTLGLSFVWETRYGGAEPPQLQQAERVCGAQSSRWTVRYLMDASTPE